MYKPVMSARDANSALPSEFDAGATFSPCRRYRYLLWRSWGDGQRRCSFVGLNPSTADETHDDPTIRKCIGFAKRWGFGALDIVNLFAWRSTDPDELLLADDPVGPANDDALRAAFREASRIVHAWGSHGRHVYELVEHRREAAGFPQSLASAEVGNLGRCKNGAPRHPLMLSYVTIFTLT
jgi:hypothetical protein